jgi:hypothetical protein
LLIREDEKILGLKTCSFKAEGVLEPVQRLEVAPLPLDLHCEKFVTNPGDSTYYSEKAQVEPQPIKE